MKKKNKQYGKYPRKEYTFDEKCNYHVNRLGNNSISEYKRAFSDGWVSGAGSSDDYVIEQAKKLEKRYKNESVYYDNVKKEYEDAKIALKEASRLKKVTFSEIKGLRAGYKASEKDAKKK